ncbi:MAG: DUF1611 domain-containing protein [Desulfobulbus sp.]|jgi:hypothetical protein
MKGKSFFVNGYSLQERLKSAKAAFTTRRVDFGRGQSLRTDQVPVSGDLLLARVVELGQQTRLHLTNGRRANLFPGDEIIVAYGNRYAPDQFEGIVPDNLAPCHLVACGGIAARCRSKHRKMKPPTVIEPVGLIADHNGRVLNLLQFAMEESPHGERRSPLTLAVVGTSMNAGKTTIAASLVRGLSAAGLKVGAAKITGTGAAGDYFLYTDSGALSVYDFTDAGFSSTYLLELEKIEKITTTIFSKFAAEGVDVVIAEIADGLYQQETAHLLSSRILRDQVDGLLFAGADSMGTIAGAEWLRRAIEIPLLAVSGAFTMSPLAIEEVEQRLDLPILTSRQLAASRIAQGLFHCFPYRRPERYESSGLIIEHSLGVEGKTLAHTC